jgi:NAD(P)-dependent dehydrogenase (short-subunit alcohol dehydrogenase family)
MKRLKGKVTLVTGAGSGIGAAIAHLFAAEGSAVMILEVDSTTGAAVAAEIKASGGVAAFQKTDISNEDEIVAAVAQAAKLFGGIDVLINNAGIGVETPVELSSAKEWDHIMGINARGAFLCTRHVVPHLVARGGGSIVNIGSFFGIRGGPSHAVYHASKGAIRQLTKTSALSLASKGIRVNVVHPGVIATPGSSRDAQAVNYIGPMRRPGTPEEVAYGCLFLASDESKYITGIDMPIDGGLSV